MKLLLFVILLYFLVPGSGQLRWNGVPMSSPLEFATLVVFILVFAQRGTRLYIRKKWAAFSWRGVVLPLLLALSFLKVLTFAWSPFGDGFDACYRSLYEPLENPGQCEKSYEGPFLRQSDLGLSNTSRTDKTIDYGVHQYDWSLPFMNEYPRLGSLWLTRFPFSVKYGALIKNDKPKDRYLPILSLGEMGATLSGNTVEQNYSDVPVLSLLRVPPGNHEFTLDFEYRDDYASLPPDEAPPMRGPYASLKVGKLLGPQEIRDIAQVRVEGWAFNNPNGYPPDAIEISLNDGTQRSFAMTSRQDVADHFNNSRLVMSGFGFVIARADLAEKSTITARFGNTRRVVGSLLLSRSSGDFSPVAAVAQSSTLLSQFSAVLTADRESLAPLAPDGRRNPGVLFTLIAWLVEVTSALLVLGLLLALLRVLGWNLVWATALGLFGWVIIYGFGAIAPSIAGMEHIVPLAALGAGIIATQRWLRLRPVFIYLPLAIVLSHNVVFDHLKRFHFSQGARWWGRLLYWWRDSDWYATRGFARTIFNEGSLEGGHAVFWFQAGPRYWSFFTQFLLGENDVLIGLLMVASGFFAVFYLSAVFTNLHRNRLSLLTAWSLVTLGMIFQADDMFAGFGFVGSSEHPTWLLMIAITGYLLGAQRETRTWLLVLLSATTAYMVPMRPNQIGGAMVFFLLLLLIVDRNDRHEWISRVARMITTFGIVISLALLHNLYYGESFVPFAANAAINVQFEWTKLLTNQSLGEAIGVVFAQTRAILYWVWPVNWSWAVVFWGSQTIWLLALLLRLRCQSLLRARSLVLLLPIAYAGPMLKFQLGSYYPRHLVAISLACLCGGLLAWPKQPKLEKSPNESNDRNTQVNDGSIIESSQVETSVA